MPCDTQLLPDQTLVERTKEIEKTLKELEFKLEQGKVTVGIGPNGAVVFQNWAPNDRRRVSDVCAYRTLAASNSSALRRAVARAEATSGRKVNPRAVAAGTHSHDGGNTWHKGHK